MKELIGGASFGLPTGLMIDAIQTHDLTTFLAALVCLAIAVAASRIVRALADQQS